MYTLAFFTSSSSILPFFENLVLITSSKFFFLLILSFEKKFKSSNASNLIDADISSFDDVSLLHVAVSCCDKSLVLELLTIGAKINDSKTLGTPIDYARRMVKKRNLCRQEKQIYHEIIQILSTMS